MALLALICVRTSCSITADQWMPSSSYNCSRVYYTAFITSWSQVQVTRCTLRRTYIECLGSSYSNTMINIHSCTTSRSGRNPRSINSCTSKLSNIRYTNTRRKQSMFQIPTLNLGTFTIVTNTAPGLATSTSYRPGVPKLRRRRRGTMQFGGTHHRVTLYCW